MKSIFRQFAVVTLACMYFPADAAYYRWTDENGKTHYSYSVPADKARLGHVELDKQGIKQKVERHLVEPENGIPGWVFSSYVVLIPFLLGIGCLFLPWLGCHNLKYLFYRGLCQFFVD